MVLFEAGKYSVTKLTKPDGTCEVSFGPNDDAIGMGITTTDEAKMLYGMMFGEGGATAEFLATNLTLEDARKFEGEVGTCKWSPYQAPVARKPGVTNVSVDGTVTRTEDPEEVAKAMALFDKLGDPATWKPLPTPGTEPPPKVKMDTGTMAVLGILAAFLLL